MRVAQQTAREIARKVTFDELTTEEIAIVASELASNLVKHAGSGTLTFTPVDTSGRRGLRIESKDSGPGIADIDQAMTDGFSTTGSLGRGLGAVHRLMDEFEIASLPGRGTQITCCRWLRAGSPDLSNQRLLEFGAATRAYRLGPVNGDAFVFKRWEHFALAGLIDGLGHGQRAAQAAVAARQYVESHYAQALRSIFRETGRACHSTRGVVMALARFDLKSEKLSFASIGNIEARLLGGETRAKFILRRGIVGGDAPEPAVTEHPWGGSQIFVLHSDGVNARWDPGDFPNLAAESATQISQRLLRALGRDDDDATVVVVKGLAA